MMHRDHIIVHHTGAATACPGLYMDMYALRRKLLA